MAIIGPRKYNILKSLKLWDLNDKNTALFERQFPNLSVGEALKQMEEFEEIHHKPVKVSKDYLEKVYGNNEKKKKELTKEVLWKMFSHSYKFYEGVDYSKDKISIENLKPLVYYFIGDLENFKKCSHVSNISKPSLKKGLLIIGGYGTGKTSVMRTFESILRRSNISFRGYTANEIVIMYESASNQSQKEAFYYKMRNGILYFDDVLTEREASNYGKANLVKDIIEERYTRKLRTYLTMNYKDGSTDLKLGLEQIGSKYGGRAYDRIFDMFNIIEFKGKSKRE